jgi:hypothetical protein
MNLFRSNKGLIPNLKPPEDKIFDLVEQYKENENLDDDQKKKIWIFLFRKSKIDILR